jgi:hypothetical protein
MATRKQIQDVTLLSRGAHDEIACPSNDRSVSTMQAIAPDLGRAAGDLGLDYDDPAAERTQVAGPSHGRRAQRRPPAAPRQVVVRAGAASGALPRPAVIGKVPQELITTLSASELALTSAKSTVVAPSPCVETETALPETQQAPLTPSGARARQEEWEENRQDRTVVLARSIVPVQAAPVLAPLLGTPRSGVVATVGSPAHFAFQRGPGWAQTPRAAVKSAPRAAVESAPPVALPARARRTGGAGKRGLFLALASLAGASSGILALLALGKWTSLGAPAPAFAASPSPPAFERAVPPAGAATSRPTAGQRIPPPPPTLRPLPATTVEPASRRAAAGVTPPAALPTSAPPPIVTATATAIASTSTPPESARRASARSKLDALGEDQLRRSER